MPPPTINSKAPEVPWIDYADPNLGFAADPLALQRLLWPSVMFYKKQRLLIESVRDNDETYCYAAHQMGKDYVAGFVVLWGFLTHPVVRIVTTSVKDDHLRVLWGEIGRYVDSSSLPLRSTLGGPLVVTHREIRKIVQPPLNNDPKARYVDKISYVKGMVSEKGEGMAGHHAPWTLLVMDECSGIDEIVPERASSWAKKIMGIGNPYGGTETWFARVCRQGDVPLGGNGPLNSFGKVTPR